MSNPYEGDSLTTTPAGLTGRNTASSGNGIGVLGTSTNGEGVHGETNSTQFAAVAGIELNKSSNIAAVYGEQRGNGPGLYGIAKATALEPLAALPVAKGCTARPTRPNLRPLLVSN